MGCGFLSVRVGNLYFKFAVYYGANFAGLGEDIRKALIAIWNPDVNIDQSFVFKLFDMLIDQTSEVIIEINSFYFISTNDIGEYKYFLDFESSNITVHRFAAVTHFALQDFIKDDQWISRAREIAEEDFNYSDDSEY